MESDFFLMVFDKAHFDFLDDFMEFLRQHGDAFTFVLGSVQSG